MSSAEGEFLDPLSKKWKISTQLGRGACGTVHALVKQSKQSTTTSTTTSSTSSKYGSVSSIQYAVKLAIQPPPATNKKKKKTVVEKNADLLNHEHMLYRNVLNDLRGSMVPNVPMAGDKGAPIGFGTIDGYRFLVMERMQAGFSSIVPLLVAETANSSTSSSIHIGPIATRLIRLMEAVHETQHVFIDVKPENFMLATTSATATKSQSRSKTTKKTTSPSPSLALALAERIRMIDLGLMESSKDVMKNKHRMNQFPNGQVVGTPVYASLNVLNGHTVSRRDDLEACIYVLIEFILALQHVDACNGKKTMEDLALLPWTKAKSDEEIKVMKERAMDDKGEIWSMIANNGNEALKGGIKSIFDLVRGLEFKEKPDYDALCGLVAELKVKVKVNAGAKATKKASAKAASSKRKVRASATFTKLEESSTPVALDTKTGSTAKRTARSTASKPSPDSPEYDEDVPPTPVININSRASRAAARAAVKEESPAPVKKREVIAARAGAKEESSSSTKKREVIAARAAAREESSSPVKNLIAAKEEESSSVKNLMAAARAAVREEESSSVKNLIAAAKAAAKEESSSSVKNLIDAARAAVKEEESSSVKNLIAAARAAAKEESPSPVKKREIIAAKEESSSSVKKREVSGARAAAKKESSSSVNKRQVIATDSDDDVEMASAAEQNDDENSLQSVQGGNEGSDGMEMDWEMVTDENTASASNANRDGAEEVCVPSLRLECVDGPHKGESFELTGTLILGSDPSKKSSRGSAKSSTFAVSKDSNASAAHAKLVLNRSGSKKSGVMMVKVSDLKSEKGTLINNKVLPNGSSRQAFVKDRIQVGDSIFRVVKSD